MNAYLSRKIKVVSFLGIMAVVWIHAFNTYPRYLQPWSLMEQGWNLSTVLQFLVSNSLARFAVPLFFLISGYLVFQSWDGTTGGWMKKVRSRVKSLLVPFLIWNALGILLVVGFLAVPALKPTVAEYLQNRTWQDHLFTFLLGPTSYQLWYLRDLFLFVLTAPVWAFLLQRKVFGWILLGFFGLLAWFIPSPPVFDFTGFFFFLVGGSLAFKPGSLDRRVSRKTWEVLLFVFLFLAVLRTCLAGIQSGGLGAALVYFPMEVAGTGALWWGYDFFTKDRDGSTPFRWGRFTFPIFLAHVPLLPLVSDAALAFWGESIPSQILLYLFLPVVLLGLIIGLDLLMGKIAPGLRKILLGGRSDV